MDRACLLLNKLNEQSYLAGQRNLCKRASYVSAVLSSNLFKHCHDIIEILETNKPIKWLEQMMQQISVPPQTHGIPPLNSSECKYRVDQIALTNNKDYYVIKLPPLNEVDRWNLKRCGLILRQNIVNLMVSNLFIASIEENSPASRTRNIKCGDQVLVVNGYPLDWRTIEQLRYGLLDQPELKGLSRNANIFDLAEHLLNEPYRHGNSETVVQDNHVVTISVARKETSYKEEGSEVSSKKKLRMPLSKSTDVYVETVLLKIRGSDDLGIGLGCDQDETGIYVVSITDNSVAAMDGILKEGDRIVQVNYENVEHMPVQQGIKSIKATSERGSFIHFKCIRPSTVPEFSKQPEFLEEAETMETLRSDSPHDVDTLDETTRIVEATPFLQRCEPLSDELSDECDLSEIQLDPMDYVRFWQGLCASGTRVILCEYELTNAFNGLGLSIEGTVEKHGPEGIPQPHHYITDVLPGAPLEIRHILEPGDELLQVNRNKLYALEHLEVAKLLHEILGKGFVICARQATFVPIEMSWRPSFAELESLYEDVEQEKKEEKLLESKDDAVFVPNAMDQLPSQQCSLTAVTVEKVMNSPERKESSSSDIASDVEKLPEFPKILYPRKYKPVVVEESQKSEILTNGRDDRTSSTALNGDINHQSVHPLPTPSESIILIRSECKKKVESKSEDRPTNFTFPRLPMPARVVSFPTGSEYLPSPSSSHTSNLDIYCKLEETGSCLPEYNYERRCWVLGIVKRAGEFLGLEVESEDGGPNGVRLMNITTGSPVDRLKENQRQTPRGSRSLLSTCAHHPPLPEPGDWIVGVGPNNFAYQSGFTARHILRKLVCDAGLFKIRYIQRTEE